MSTLMQAPYLFGPIALSLLILLVIYWLLLQTALLKVERKILRVGN